MATPRNRQYHPGGSGGGSGGGLAAILGALVGAPGLVGGEDITDSIDPEVDLGTSEAPVRGPYGVQKATLGQKIFNPRGVQASQGMADALKFEDYQNQLRSGLVGQHNQGQIELEKVRHAGDLAEKEAASQAALKKLAWEHASTPEEYERLLNDPEVKAATRQGMIDTGYKQGFLNDKVNSEVLDSEAKRPTLGFMGVGTDNMVNPLTKEAFSFEKPLENPPAPGFEGGLKNTILGGPRKVSGGLNGQYGGGGRLNAGVPTTTQPVLKPKEEMGLFGGPVPTEMNAPTGPSLLSRGLEGFKNFVTPEKLPVAGDPFNSAPQVQVEPQGLLNGIQPIPFQPPQQEPSALEKFRLLMKLRQQGVPLGF